MKKKNEATVDQLQLSRRYLYIFAWGFFYF